MSNSKTLDEVCLAIVDCEHKTAPIDESGDYFAVGTPAMRGDVIDYSQARRISKETFDNWTRRMLPQHGDLLFAREAPVGPIVRIPVEENVAPGQRTVLLRPDPDQVDSVFLYYLLGSPLERRRLQERAAGSTVAHLNVSDVRGFRLPILPKLSDQVAICAILGALDDKIAANLKLAEIADSLALTTFMEAAEDSDEVHALVDVCELISRGVTPKYSENDDDLKVLNQKCIRDQRVTLDPARRTRAAKTKTQLLKTLRVNDVLVNSTGEGTLGRVARWTGPSEATVDSHISIVRFDPAKIDPTCAGFAMLHAQPIIEMMGEGSTGQTELSREQLGRLQVRFIAREKESTVKGILNGLSDLTERHLSESQVLSSVRDALLPQLMSGKLRVRDAEKQVEAVL